LTCHFVVLPIRVRPILGYWIQIRSKMLKDCNTSFSQYESGCFHLRIFCRVATCPVSEVPKLLVAAKVAVDPPHGQPRPHVLVHKLLQPHAELLLEVDVVVHALKLVHWVPEMFRYTHCQGSIFWSKTIFIPPLPLKMIFFPPPATRSFQLLSWPFCLNSPQYAFI
jgi:hypothetical protein